MKLVKIISIIVGNRSTSTLEGFRLTAYVMFIGLPVCAITYLVPRALATAAGAGFWSDVIFFAFLAESIMFCIAGWKAYDHRRGEEQALLVVKELRFENDALRLLLYAKAGITSDDIKLATQKVKHRYEVVEEG